jgi:hypothetical protein
MAGGRGWHAKARAAGHRRARARLAVGGRGGGPGAGTAGCQGPHHLALRRAGDQGRQVLAADGCFQHRRGPCRRAEGQDGHFHVIIDADLPPLDEPIPNNEHYLHFGGGQTEVRLELPPGKHTLQLLLGDAAHVPNDPPLMSKKITVIVP